MHDFWLEWIWLAVAAIGTVLSLDSAVTSKQDKARTYRRTGASAANKFLANIIWISSLWILATHALLCGGAVTTLIMAPPPPPPTHQMYVVIGFAIVVDLVMTAHAWKGKEWRRKLAEGDFGEVEQTPKQNGGKGLLGGNG